jgi:hypothetical protein
MTFREVTWKRARWPSVRRVIRCEADMGTPIPIPGNLDSDFYDGDDAIYSSTFTAATVDEALTYLVKSTANTRQRYGGSAWSPAAA